MDFKIGDRVVYPSHGVAVVEGIEELDLGGALWPCYQLRLLNTNTGVVVPVQNVRSIGVRKTAARHEVTQALDRLRQDAALSNPDWKGRFKENTDRMRGGRLEDLVFVLKSLTLLATTRTLSFREKTMLDKARQLVVGEIAAGTRTTPEAAADLVRQALGACA